RTSMTTTATRRAMTLRRVCRRGAPPSAAPDATSAGGVVPAPDGPVVALRALDPLGPHAGARRNRRARLAPFPGRFASIEPGEEPRNQPVHRPGPDRRSREEADDRQDGKGPELLVDPVSPEGTEQGGYQEDEPDLGEEGEIRSRLTGLGHGHPDKAAGV